MKSITILLTISALLLFGFYIYSTTRTPNTEVGDKQSLVPEFIQDEKPLTVEYTDKGYIPSVLEVSSGETVTFINKSNRSMWVASDNHPTHSIYPEFDQKGTSRSEESYSFKFERVGEWSYHDHLNPRATGTVRVN